MRPKGDIRQAVESCIPLSGQGDAVTWRDVAAQLHSRRLVDCNAPSEVRIVRRTVENMATAGEVLRVGKRAVPGARRQMTTYARQSSWATAPFGNDLGGVMRSWIASV